MNCVYYYISSHQDNVRIINMWYGFYVWKRIFFVTWMWDEESNENVVILDQRWHYFLLKYLEMTGIVGFYLKWSNNSDGYLCIVDCIIITIGTNT